MEMLRKIFPKRKLPPWEQRVLDQQLVQAVKEDNLKEARRLLRKGADIGAQGDFNDPSLLHLTAATGSAEMVGVLIKAGADVNKSDIFAHGATPLQMAVNKSNYATAKALIEAQADLEKADILNPPLLYQAVMRNDPKMMELLLDAGADVNAQLSLKGLTPLHLAVTMSNERMVTLLLSRGADVTIADRKGIRPMDMERGRQNTAIHEAFQSSISGKHANRVKSLRRRKPSRKPSRQASLKS